MEGIFPCADTIRTWKSSPRPLLDTWRSTGINLLSYLGLEGTRQENRLERSSISVHPGKLARQTGRVTFTRTDVGLANPASDHASRSTGDVVAEQNAEALPHNVLGQPALPERDSGLQEPDIEAAADTVPGEPEDSFRSAFNASLGGVWHEVRMDSAFHVGELCVRCKEEPEDLSHI
eukprot:4635061-Amphidinium_carterae.1